MASALRTQELWTIDDWSSTLQYGDRTLWNTPDPSKEQDLYDSFGYNTGTYHETSTEGQSVSLNFTGISVALYGATGPDYGTYSVNIDGTEATYSAWAAERTNSTKLWEAGGLQPFAGHSFTVTNGNASFLIDHVDVLADLAAPGSDSHVTVYEETSATLTGKWSFNKSPAFSGGGSGYTNEDGATASLTFVGSSVAIFGDTNSDHGFYSVQLDDQEPITLMSATGCGLSFVSGARCELIEPNLMALFSYLSEGNHTIVLTNIAGPNKTYVDIDRIVVARPDKYLLPPSPATSGSSTSTPTITGNGQISVTRTGTSSVPSQTNPSDAANHVLASGSLLLMLWPLLFR